MSITTNSLQIIGSILEIIGIVLMSNLYWKNVYGKQIPYMLISALWRGESAKDGICLSDFSPEKRLFSLQGLALIGVGFLVQLIANLIALLGTVFHK